MTAGELSLGMRNGAGGQRPLFLKSPLVITRVCVYFKVEIQPVGSPERGPAPRGSAPALVAPPHPRWPRPASGVTSSFPEMAAALRAAVAAGAAGESRAPRGAVGGSSGPGRAGRRGGPGAEARAPGLGRAPGCCHRLGPQGP